MFAKLWGLYSVMVRMAASAIAVHSGRTLYPSVANAHAVLEISSGGKCFRRRMASAASALISGRFSHTREATAHAVLAKFWFWNSVIMRIDCAAIAFLKGVCWYTRAAQAHTRLAMDCAVAAFVPKAKAVWARPSASPALYLWPYVVMD
eukprot:UN3583